MRSLANYPPENYTFEGDPTACHLLLPLARQMVRRAWLAGQPTCQMQLADDAYIRAELTNGLVRVIIRAGNVIGIYMETGFLQHFSFAPANEQTYFPAYRHYNDSLNNYFTARLIEKKPTFQGELVLTGNKLKNEHLSEDYSIALGWEKPYRSQVLTLCSPYDGCITYRSIDPGYCTEESQITADSGSSYIDEIIDAIVSGVGSNDPNKRDVRQLKECQAKLKPSLYSGKMALFIQAVYGSQRGDYRTMTIPFSPQPLYINNIDLNYTMADNVLTTYTCGIYTTNDYRYYLVKIGFTDFYYWRLTPSNAGEALRKHLAAKQIDYTDAEIRRIEAYILSTCTIETQESVSGTNTRFGGTDYQFSFPVEGVVIKGAPIAYGWHFDWVGHNARMITHTSPKDAGEEDEFIWSRTYTLSISLDDRENMHITASQIKGPDKWSGVSDFSIWRPDYFTGLMVAKVNIDQGSFGWGPEHSSDAEFEADIYCYYDNDNNVQTVSIFRDYDSNTTASGWVYVGGVSGGNGLIEYYETYKRGRTINRIKLNGSVIHELDKKELSTRSTNELKQRSPGAKSGNLNATVCTVTTLQQYNSQTFKMMVAIPAFDCSAFLSAQKFYSDRALGSVYTATIYIENTGFTDDSDRPNRIFNQASGPDTPEYYANAAQFAANNIIDNDEFGSYSIFYDYPNYYVQAQYIHDPDMELHFKYTSRANSPAVIHDAEGRNIFELDKYFDFQAKSDITGYFLPVSRSSCGGASRLDTAEIDQYDGGYIYDTAVGWA